jgi:hypothetical protein
MDSSRRLKTTLLYVCTLNVVICILASLPSSGFQPLLNQDLGLGAVRFIDNHNDVIAIAQYSILFAFVIAKFLNQSKDDAFILRKELSYFFAVFGLSRFVFLNGFGVVEISIDLSIKVFSISDDDKCKVAFEFAEDFTGVEDHREAFAKTLRVLEDS